MAFKNKRTVFRKSNGPPFKERGIIKNRLKGERHRRLKRKFLKLDPICKGKDCGRKLTYETATWDHIIPISRGGTNAQENLQLMCKRCNEEKGNVTPGLGERKKLIWKPFEQLKSPSGTE